MLRTITGNPIDLHWLDHAGEALQALLRQNERMASRTRYYLDENGTPREITEGTELPEDAEIVIPLESLDDLSIIRDYQEADYALQHCGIQLGREN